MKKVVTERPRSGGGVKTLKGERRDFQRCDWEDQPKREKIRAKWSRETGQKQFTDVLGPLYGYLLKQVGRPWDKVYSEITKNFPKTSVQNRHIHTHIWQFVEEDVQMIGKTPYHKRFFRYSSEYIEITSNGRWQQMYINPNTGLLCIAKRKKKTVESPSVVPGVVIYPGLQYHRVKGVWYAVEVQKIVMECDIFGKPRPKQCKYINGSIYDAALEKYFNSLKEVVETYQGYWIGVSKRPLTKQEIRMACLDQIN